MRIFFRVPENADLFSSLIGYLHWFLYEHALYTLCSFSCMAFHFCLSLSYDL